MEKNNVDKKIVKWSDIFEELLIDVKTLTKDLSDSINYVAVSALVVMLIGGAALGIGLIRGFEMGLDMGSRYIASGVIIFSVCAAIGSTHLRKWHTLKQKYKRLLSLQREMESN